MRIWHNSEGDKTRLSMKDVDYLSLETFKKWQRDVWEHKQAMVDAEIELRRPKVTLSQYLPTDQKFIDWGLKQSENSKIAAESNTFDGDIDLMGIPLLDYNVPFVDPTEDLTTWTVVQPTFYTMSAAQAHGANAANYPNTAQVYKDYGVDHFNAFTHLFELYVTSYSRIGIWQVSNRADNGYNANPGAYAYQGADGQDIKTLGEPGGGFSASISCLYSAINYIKVIRSTTTFTLYVYSDSARTTLVASGANTNNLGATDKFRYLRIMNGGLAGGYSWQNWYEQNVDIGEAVAAKVNIPVIANYYKRLRCCTGGK